MTQWSPEVSVSALELARIHAFWVRGRPRPGTPVDIGIQRSEAPPLLLSRVGDHVL
jgi:hypothetical protein